MKEAKWKIELVRRLPELRKQWGILLWNAGKSQYEARGKYIEVLKEKNRLEKQYLACKKEYEAIASGIFRQFSQRGCHC